MFRRSNLACLAVTFLVVLAGCSGKDAKPKGSSTIDAVAPTASADAETCGLEGFIGDEAFTPIPDAQVALTGTEFSTRTAADGRFSFSFLPPNSYQVVVLALGYEEASKRVNCAAGTKIDKLFFNLKELPKIGEPFMLFFGHKGKIGCALGLVVSTDDACKPGGVAPQNPGLNPEANNTFIVHLNPEVGTKISGAVFALSWKPTGAGSATFLSLSYAGAKPNAGVVKSYCQDSFSTTQANEVVDGKSVLCVRLEKPLEEGKWAYNIDPGGEDLVFLVTPGKSVDAAGDRSSKVVYQQDFEFAISVFYNNEPIPEGYTGFSE